MIGILFSLYIITPVYSFNAGLVYDITLAVNPEVIPVKVSPGTKDPPVLLVTSLFYFNVPCVLALFVFAKYINLPLAPLVPPRILSSVVKSPETALT